jgi:beta-aspartyl-peptidase (threonine type)
MNSRIPAIVVHGGAGEWRKERRELGIRGVKDAAQIGFEVLKRDGNALDAVESAVMSMEDDEAFNAGVGSSFTLDGAVEMEASLMDGRTLTAGATGLLRNIKHPIRLARIIMDKTDHIFIVGRSAEKLADIFGLERRDPQTTLRAQYWKNLKAKLQRQSLAHLQRLSALLKSNPDFSTLDTVGAVAVDSGKNVAAATSTGGISLKIPGRIGDSPLIGCGTYADNEEGACSTTGIGEIAIRLVLAKNTCNLMRIGQKPQEAAENSIKEVNRRIDDAPNHMGLIALDPNGRIGAAHNSPHLCWAYMTPQKSNAKPMLKARIVKEKA